MGRRKAAAAPAFVPPAPPPPTGRELYFGERSPCFSRFVGDAARQVLRGLKLAGTEIVGRARSAHGSDCDCSAEHLQGPMSQCRCIRVVRLRVLGSGDWLLAFGDCQETAKQVGEGAFTTWVTSNTVRLQGPYTHDTPLQYGGGFWNRVEV